MDGGESRNNEDVYNLYEIERENTSDRYSRVSLRRKRLPISHRS
jgi:hypothetical protein